MHSDSGVKIHCRSWPWVVCNGPGDLVRLHVRLVVSCRSPFLRLLFFLPLLLPLFCRHRSCLVAWRCSCCFSLLSLSLCCRVLCVLFFCSGCAWGVVFPFCFIVLCLNVCVPCRQAPRCTQPPLPLVLCRSFLLLVCCRFFGGIRSWFRTRPAYTWCRSCVAMHGPAGVCTQNPPCIGQPLAQYRLTGSPSSANLRPSNGRCPPPPPRTRVIAIVARK